jgi:hypothetical protein
LLVLRSIGRIFEIPESHLSDFRDELLLKIVAIVALALMKIEKEKKENSDGVALNTYVLYAVHIEEYMSKNLSEAKQHTQHLQIIIVLHVLISYFSTSLASLKTVIVILKLSHYPR